MHQFQAFLIVTLHSLLLCIGFDHFTVAVEFVDATFHSVMEAPWV